MIDAIDTHVHLSTQDVDRYPRASKDGFATEPYVHPLDQYLESMASSGVRAATVVQPFGLYGTDNAYHADCASADDRLSGICGVPATSAGADDLRFWVRERGMGGGRVITLGQGVQLDDGGLAAVCRAAVELDVPLLLLTSRKHLADLPGLASAHPTLRIVLDHCGLPGPPDRFDARDVLELLQPLCVVDNLYFKVSTSLAVSQKVGRPVIELLFAGAGGDRIIWGTNFPLTDLGGYRTTVAASSAALKYLSAAERKSMFSDTATQLWPALGVGI